MEFIACKEKIDRYLTRNEHQPLIVDVQNEADQAELIQIYRVGKNTLVPMSKYGTTDEIPRFEMLLNDLATKEGVLIITGVSFFLKLEGEQELKRKLRMLSGISIPGHAIIFTYQCERFLPLADPRAARRIIILDGLEKNVPEIVFTAPTIPLSKDCEVIKGIENLASVAEKGTIYSTERVYLVTKKRKEHFPYALYNITSLRSPYDAVTLKDPSTTELSEELGTTEQWNRIMKAFQNQNMSSWADLVDAEFGSRNMLGHIYSNYKNYSPWDQWLYLIAIKLFGAKNNWCLTVASQKARDLKAFPRQICRCLLDKSIGDEDFWDCYISRKDVLREMGDFNAELSSYCSLVFSKGIDTIYYLTDNTQIEQEAIFKFLDQYGLEMDREKLMDVLEKVYPALYHYLQPYYFGNDLLDHYFQDYKYQKVINKLLPEFEKVVMEQAVDRQYNSILQPRSSVIEKLNRSGAQLYFMDAMGVEYLSYILSVCKKLDLIVNITVCAAELPSITSCNKEFLELFANAAHETVPIKEIDDIKHHGKHDYDFYKNSKLPIHLIEELKIIEKVLKLIKRDLSGKKIQRAFMIADHGASRLAVLYDKENEWEMSEKGQHCGRCCPKSDLDKQPDCAADAGEFWALANYERFKGGRKANVEVHGGATLEEVCVPVIEITYMEDRPEIILLPVDKKNVAPDETLTIEVSFRKKAAMLVFSTVPLQNVRVVINGVPYAVKDIGNNFYRVDMPDLKKPGTYYADVLSGDNTFAENLRFIIKREGHQSNELI